MGIDYTAEVTYQRVVPEFNIVPVPPAEVLAAFLASGWSFGSDAVVRYTLFAEDGDPVFHARPASEIAPAVAECNATMSAGRTVAMTLLWYDTNLGGTLYLPPKSDPHVDRFLFSADREWRKSHPELGAYIDYNWYTSRIVSPLRSLGLGAGIDWKES